MTMGMIDSNTFVTQTMLLIPYSGTVVLAHSLFPSLLEFTTPTRSAISLDMQWQFNPIHYSKAFWHFAPQVDPMASFSKTQAKHVFMPEQKEGVTQTQLNNGPKVFRALWYPFAFGVQFLILIYKLMFTKVITVSSLY
jgi:hypothetical protein